MIRPSLVAKESIIQKIEQSHILIKEVLTMTLTFKIEDNFFHMTLWLMMLHHQKPECSVKKKIDYCIQGEGHSEGSKC